MTPSPGSQPTDSRGPYSSQTVSVSWGEGDTTPGSRTFQFGVSECIETKTVTTTTTTKRTFPPLFVREPRPLESLDVKEYPLASKSTPPQLAQFTFDVPGFDLFAEEDAPSKQSLQTRRRSTPPKRSLRLSRTANESFDSVSTRLPSRSPSESYPRRSKRTTTRAESPSRCVSKPSHNKTRPASSHAASDRPRRSTTLVNRRESERLARQVAGVLATPDAAEFAPLEERPTRIRKVSTTPEPVVPSQTPTAYDVASPIASDTQTIFSGNVATPPITDADVEPFMDADETLQQSVRSLHQSRHPLESAAAQDADASLPSPRLSPKLTAAQPESDSLVVSEEDDLPITSQALTQHQLSWNDASQTTSTDDSEMLSPRPLVTKSRGYLTRESASLPQLIDPRSMLESFDAMPSDMKTLMLYQFLRRCPRKTLRIVADVVNPSLQCDFLKQLPLELSYHVLSYLDYRDLCRAARVSKHWRNIIDSNETGWKELFDRDGFKLPSGELEKAIRQGWGWQDPYGPAGCEVDLSAQRRLNSTEAELTQVVCKAEPTSARLRSSKRKRGLNAISGVDRSKRRASASAALKDTSGQLEVKQHKSEGPLSAANAAALAVPDPQLGVPSLRRLHLFKSLYRRHYMIRESWTNGKVQPSHVAFTAHPRHVITCLQFDDDKIITGSDDTLIHVYDTKTGKLRKRLEGHEGGVWALQYEGNVLVSGSTDRSVRVWDIEKGLCTQVFYGHTSTVRCLQILMPSPVSKDRKKQPEMMPAKPLIITGSRDNQLRVWRLPEAGSRRYIQTGPPANDSDCPYFIRTLAGHTHSVRAIAAHGDTLVSGSYDHSVRVWRISTGEALHVLHGHTQKVYSVVLDQERNRCISGAMDSLVKIWDLATGACLYTLEGHNLLVGILDLRDERLVSAAADSTLRIWDPENGRCKNVLSAHTGAITCFQHDGRKVISGSERTVKMWDIASGNCLQDLLTDLGSVWQLKFDYRRCVAAVQRQSITYIEILDFGAVRDGKPPEELGRRILLDEPEVQRLMEEDV